MDSNPKWNHISQIAKTKELTKIIDRRLERDTYTHFALIFIHLKGKKLSPIEMENRQILRDKIKRVDNWHEIDGKKFRQFPVNENKK